MDQPSIFLTKSHECSIIGEFPHETVVSMKFYANHFKTWNMLQITILNDDKLVEAYIAFSVNSESPGRLLRRHTMQQTHFYLVQNV